MNRQELLIDVLAAIERADKTYTFTGPFVDVHVHLPTPQRSGTYTQNNAYNRMKAQEIVETHTK